jgi:sulfite exporter TauE/SafE
MLGGFGEIFGINDQLKGIVSIVAGTVMLLISLQLLNLIRLPKLNSYPRLKNSSSFLIGIVNVFMPCGSLYIAMLYAVACSSYLYGGLIMLIFALITSISLFITALMASKIKSSNHILKYLSVLIIIVLGIQFIFHGISFLNPNNNDNMKMHNNETMEKQDN